MARLSDILWRIIPLETHDAFMNMALDEAASEAIALGESAATIRFYQWRPSAVSIGYFQSLEDEIAVDVCEREGVDIVRRRTGGGAVYHDAEGEITYSVMVPEKDFCVSGGDASGDDDLARPLGANDDLARPLGITESYHEICGWIIRGLSKVGIEAEFKPINDVVVMVGGSEGGASASAGVANSAARGGVAAIKKISGNAQTRRGGVILQHGTILWKVDVRKMFSLLKVGKEKIADKLIAAVEDRVTSVQNVCMAQGRDVVTREALYDALFHGFTEGKKFEIGAWTSGELARTEELARERYKSKEWNWMR